MTTRLNKDNRAGIVKAILQYRFKKDFETIVRARAVLADEVYADLYDPPLLVLMRSLPEGYLRTQSELQVRFGTSKVYLGFSGGWNRWSTPSYVEPFKEPAKVWRLVADKHDSQHAADYDARHPFSIKFERIQNLATDLTNSLAEANAKLTAVVRSVANVEKLIELWPEVEPFARPYIVTSTGNVKQLPVIQTEALNNLLDLPVPDEQQAA